MSGGALAFNINYAFVEINCAEAGCTKAILRGCGAVHRRHTGDATLTVVGSIQQIQQIASEIIPGWPVTPEAPPADPVLTSTELDAMVTGQTVMAGGFADGARGERYEWWKLDTGRWDSRSTYACLTDGKAGVSSIWLANNRQPKRLT